MTFLESIASIPGILTQMVNNRTARMSGVAELIEGRTISRVVFIGSGSSFNSALAACPLFDRYGIEADVVFPNQLATYTTTLDRETLYVAISQGGATRLVFESIRKLHDAGCTVCSITADVASPIAREADVALEMGCGQEQFRYRTVGVATTIVSCWQLAVTVALDNGVIDEAGASACDRDLQAVIDSMPDRLRDSIAWYEKHRFPLMRARYMMFAGADDLWAVAREADIKAMEMVPMITRSFELEEIVHGPQNAFDASGCYVIFARKGADANKARAVAAFLNKNVGFCAIVGNAGDGAQDCVFDEANEVFGALEHLTFAQVLAYRLAIDHGRDLTRPINAGIAKCVSKEL